MNTKTNLFIASLLLLLSCNNKSKSYQLFIQNQHHTFNIEETKNNHLEISSSLVAGESMELSSHANWDKVFNGVKDKNQEQWRFADRTSDKIKEVILAPYYSMFSYNILERMRAPELAILHPNCPVKTNYLLMVVMDNGIPLFGCVHNEPIRVQ